MYTDKGNVRNKKKDRAGRIAMDVIIGCLVVIVLFSGWKVWNIMNGYHSDQKTYEDIAETAHAEDTEDGQVIDFGALEAVNPDVVAWLRCEDTVIDYPVVQGSDNEKYLHTLFDGSSGGCGTLFVEAVTEEPFRQFNTIVYGHHMRDGTMFASLEDFKDPEFTEEHPEMELITPEGSNHMQIWAFVNQPADSDIYATNFHEEKDREAYIDLIRDKAEYLTDIDDEISADNRIVILSTCAYEYKNARYMLACVMSS
jgi:sortase B